MGVIVRSFPWICNASIKDKESSNVESLHNCLGLRASSGRRISLHHTVRSEKTGFNRVRQNLDDGSVEVVACGEEGQVEKLMQWLKSGGPRSARVERVLSEPHHPSGELTDFRIR
ncbi:acylphosphatase [Escherichia coli]|nr:acylphosphatase [Escherichia coli]